ncbi:LPXTG cell wall anchor domain-containing protein [Streptomyces sp. NPDC058872]|uniref:LPXTG cell wall anchor domain-containing protein n=1 Tax=Streptomyces sp. NPDC058872 TaxID=3346661 RepID=UPI00368F0D02
MTSGSSSTGSTTTTGGSSTTTGGGSSANGGAGTCTVDLDGAECVDTEGGTKTDQAGSQPVQQGEAKEELAETGAAETSFLVIGAATMIAGGIGFRMLPRLVAGGRTAA